MELDEVADRLYALDPEDFTSARDEAAKDARSSGDRDLAQQVKELRRPSVSAWLVNRLARDRRELLDDLLDLGPALAEAQAGGQGDALRELGKQRRDLVQAVVASAVELVDRPVTAAVRTEVEQTLDAALADPDTADAVRTGRLVRAVAYAGFGTVDLSGAVAVPRRSEAPQDEPDVAAAERAALEAAGALDDAVRACELAQQAAERAHREADAAADAVADLERRLEEARTEQQELRQAAETADRTADERAEAVRTAQDAADEARQALDRLRRGS